MCEERMTSNSSFCFRHQLAQGLLNAGAHAGIETGGRLVEEEQLGPRADSRDESQLHEVALRQVADAFLRVQLQAGAQAVCQTSIPTLVDPARERQHLPDPQLVIEGRSFGSPETGVGGFEAGWFGGQKRGG